MTFSPWAALIVLVMATASPSLAAEELSLGVFLPQAGFATNAERNAYAQRVATELSEASEGEFTVTARTFARRSDVVAFIAAKRIDFLITDGLFVSNRQEKTIAHSLGAPVAALYGRDKSSVLGLQGGTVAVASVGSNDVRYYLNTALEGEVAERHFGKVRQSKDAASALGAVQANVADGAFAPAGHPAAAGLKLLARASQLPGAVVAVVNRARLTPARQLQIVSALVGGAGRGGVISGWAEGAGSALKRGRTLSNSSPRLLTSPPILTQPVERRLAPPPMRLKLQGTLGKPTVSPSTLVSPTLPES